MSNSEKKLIYVVESSRVLAKLISTELKEQGYNVEIFKTGLEALKKIMTTSPDCIVADKILPLIDGMELCRILKEGSTKSTIPYILFSAEETVLDFWSNSIGADDVVSISQANFDELKIRLEKLLKNKYIETNSFFLQENNERVEYESKMSEDEKLMFWVVDAMDKSDFYLNMDKNVLKLFEFVKDIDLLVQKIFEMSYKVCEYDVISLILDGAETRFYNTGIENLPEETAQELVNICKADYEQKAKKNHTVTYEMISVPDVVQGEAKVAKLESYRDYEIKAGDKFIGSIHIASHKKKIMTYKVQSSIEFILPALGYILEEALHHETISHSEKNLRNVFSKFVPEEIIDEMIKKDESEQQGNNEKRNVVILMCDIRSFTSISEINQPEDVVGFLNTYFTHMVNIVKKYGGTVDKFIGDAIMVLFGAPISYNDNAQRAVQAAIEMYSQLDQISTGKMKFPEGIKLDIGIGIHYGDVIVGNIGSIDKTSYTVIGDTVNLASRLEGLTKLYGAKVIISEAVREELSEEMNVLLLDSVKVKGKKESVHIYRADEKPLPSAFTEAYSKGFKSYTEGAFALAKPYFEKALEVIPNDKAAKLLLARCNEFNENKPENWDGAVALTSK